MSRCLSNVARGYQAPAPLQGEIWSLGGGRAGGKLLQKLILFPNGFLGHCASAEVHPCMQAIQEPMKEA